MRKINFVICVHNHQPVGNFDFVLEDALSKAYLAFLNVLAQHRSIKVVLHVSGALLEWVEKHRPEYLDLVRNLTARGQLELMTGGFYEPVLPSVPDEDKIGQTKKLSSFVREKFGFRPRGLWLAERVWEPSLASAIARAGVEYTVVDDSHFKSAGLSEDDLLGYYLTEDQGAVIKVFSGSKRLRYLIPYAGPEETLNYLRAKASESNHNLLVFADDGEKFGIWPGTYRLCYEEKWLERFFRTLEENSDWISVVTFSEYMSQHRPLGWVFLPTASYAEMMEWCLPVDAQLRYHEFLEKLKTGGAFDRYESFVKGGFWRNFFSRYPESNWMHKRMLYARRKVAKLRVSSSAKAVGCKELSQPALNEIWKAQCNCAYWHGVFGGLYLPHLREAIYRHIIRAENIVSRISDPSGFGPAAVRVDVDGDGADEIVLANEKIACFVSPARGGSVIEIDDKVREINLVNTLARRKEAYHGRIRTVASNSPGETAASIHDAVVAKEDSLEELLIYDRFPRVCLIDHFLPVRTSLNEMVESRFDELGSFAGTPYTEKTSSREGEITLSAAGLIRSAPEPVRLTVEKTIVIPSDEAWLEARYGIDCERQINDELLFATELNLLIPSGGGAQGIVRSEKSGTQDVRLSSPGEFLDVKQLEIRDDHVGLLAKISMGRACKLWQFPVETVSLSESGLERIYQGTCIVAVWSLPSATKKAHLDIQMEFKSSSARNALSSTRQEVGR